MSPGKRILEVYLYQVWISGTAKGVGVTILFKTQELLPPLEIQKLKNVVILYLNEVVEASHKKFTGHEFVISAG